MARKSAETAEILTKIYEETFSNDSYSSFRIDWPQLRSITEGPKLSDEYLCETNHDLCDSGYALIPFDDILVVVMQSDLSGIRSVSAQLVERYLPGGDDDSMRKEIEDGELDDV